MTDLTLVVLFVSHFTQWRSWKLWRALNKWSSRTLKKEPSKHTGLVRCLASAEPFSACRTPYHNEIGQRNHTRRLVTGFASFEALELAGCRGL